MRQRFRHLFVAITIVLSMTRFFADSLHAEEPGLVGHWKLTSDARDTSGHNNHGTNHGVTFDPKGRFGTFDGLSNYIEVPNNPSLKLGTNDFSISVHVHTEKDLDDVIGDVLSMYDPSLKRGFTLNINSGAGGYQGQGSDRHVYFGIDNDKRTDWQDCGRPNATSNYVSNSLSVFKGKLYAATMDAKDEKEWCHVYRYEGNQKWHDCGRVGDARTTGVGPLIVHDGNLYATTSTYDWTRVGSGKYAASRVYRYDGHNNWHDCGKPSNNRTITTAISYKGKLYTGGGPNTYGVFEYDGTDQWSNAILFPRSGSKKCFPHSMSRYNGKMYVGYPSVYSFDGKEWKYAGVPVEPENKLQTHALAVYQGKLIAGTWPLAKVAMYEGGEKWKEIGRIGEDGTEVMDLLVYNGKLYGASIPRAEVCRYDDQTQWTSLKRFYSPEGWKPIPPQENAGNPSNDELNSWTRVTSMTIYDGKLFAGIGSCTSSVLDAPADVRGRVFSMEAGKCASDDNDLGHGWKHIVAMRAGTELKIYVDGKLVAKSSSLKPTDYDISTDRPLLIGFGQTDYFAGKIANLRIYNRALDGSAIEKLAAEKIDAE